MTRRLTVRTERWPTKGTFRISRDSYTGVDVVVCEIEDGRRRGRGEARPYARYGETVDGVRAVIESAALAVAGGLDRDALRRTLDAGAARNAIDAALIDLEAKLAGIRAWELLGLPAPIPVATAFTLGIDAPAAMGSAARREAHRPFLKLKLAGDDLDAARVAAVREAAPAARLIVDANEAIPPASLAARLAEFAALDVALVEQPLDARDDALLGTIDRPIPICADESFHGRADVERIRARYDAVNVKLDKTGGLTEAIEVVRAARDAGLRVMLGCMMGTSLAMAPACLLAGHADFVDLDGPLLLERDRDPGIAYVGPTVGVPPRELWG